MLGRQIGKLKQAGAGEVKMAISWKPESSSMPGWGGWGVFGDPRPAVESEVDGGVWLGWGGRIV